MLGEIGKINRLHKPGVEPPAFRAEGAGHS